MGKSKLECRRIRADVIVVQDWDELKSLGTKVKDKIVLFNPPWKNYDDNVEYRMDGAN